MKSKPTAPTGKGPALRVGETAVCGACLRTTFDRPELASRQCRCGGRIIAMPRDEVEARRRDRR